MEENAGAYYPRGRVARVFCEGKEDTRKVVVGMDGHKVHERVLLARRLLETVPGHGESCPSPLPFMWGWWTDIGGVVRILPLSPCTAAAWKPLWGPYVMRSAMALCPVAHRAAHSARWFGEKGPVLPWYVDACGFSLPDLAFTPRCFSNSPSDAARGGRVDDPGWADVRQQKQQRLIVRNLKFNAKEADLAAAFSAHGPLNEVRQPREG